MDPLLQQVHACLTHTLSANQQERQAAEAMLEQNKFASQVGTLPAAGAAPSRAATRVLG